MMGHVPRYDDKNVDPLGMKRELTKLSTDILLQLRKSSNFRSKIFIGSHHHLNCSGTIRQSRYGNIGDNNYDGIHLSGLSGRQALTQSVLSMLQAFSIVLPHDQCPQAVYQREMADMQQTQTRRRQPRIQGLRRLRLSGQQQTSQADRLLRGGVTEYQQPSVSQWGRVRHHGKKGGRVRSSESDYEVPTSNRFSMLSKNLI